MPPLQILLIEDDLDDISFFEYALGEIKKPIALEIINQGDKVLPYLNKSSKLPDIIVMDLNLPRVHGRDIIKTLKSEAGFKHLPVFILTTSTAKEDINYCAVYGAEKYFTKPNSIDEYVTIVNDILSSVSLLEYPGKK